jgi:hypothetical protein
MDRSAQFWSVAEPLLADEPALERGTMMGSECLRANGQFVAMIHVHTGQLIVKLAHERVGELVAAGEGEHFAPNGRVFREWLAVAGDTARWKRLLGEGCAFALGR